LFEDLFPQELFGSERQVGKEDRDRQGQKVMLPAMKVQEGEQHHVVSIDMPGVQKEDISIEVQNNQLRVSAERKEEHDEDDDQGKSHSYSYQTYYQALSIP